MDGMMHEPIPDECFVDHAVLRIEDMEPTVRTVSVPSVDQLTMQTKHLVLKVSFESLNVRLLSLPATKLTPSREQIL